LHGIANGDDAAAVARTAGLGMRRIEADATGRFQWDRDQHRTAAHVGGDGERLWRVHGVGNGKGRAVGKDAARRKHGDLSGFQLGRVEGERAEAIGV
jgi:hypothetical protein